SEIILRAEIIGRTCKSAADNASIAERRSVIGISSTKATLMGAPAGFRSVTATNCATWRTVVSTDADVKSMCWYIYGSFCCESTRDSIIATGIRQYLGMTCQVPAPNGTRGLSVVWWLQEGLVVGSFFSTNTGQGTNFHLGLFGRVLGGFRGGRTQPAQDERQRD